jgi:hypothetical protein
VSAVVSSFQQIDCYVVKKFKLSYFLTFAVDRGKCELHTGVWAVCNFESIFIFILYSQPTIFIKNYGEKETRAWAPAEMDSVKLLL